MTTHNLRSRNSFRHPPPHKKSHSRSYSHAQCASIKQNKNLQHTTNYVIIIFELYGSNKNKNSWTLSNIWLMFISIFLLHTNIILFVFNSMITTDNNRNSTSTKKIFSLNKKRCWMNFDFLLMGYGLSNYARARSKRNLWFCNRKQRELWTCSVFKTKLLASDQWPSERKQAIRLTDMLDSDSFWARLI